jgi:hypothetical protein
MNEIEEVNWRKSVREMPTLLNKQLGLLETSTLLFHLQRASPAFILLSEDFGTLCLHESKAWVGGADDVIV